MNKNPFGLSDIIVSQIQQVFQHYPQIEQALVYGSRAKGNFKPGSDIDLTLYGPYLTTDVLAEIYDNLDDLLLPYTIDLSIFEAIENPQLQDHIKRVGTLFYKKSE